MTEAHKRREACKRSRIQEAVLKHVRRIAEVNPTISLIDLADALVEVQTQLIKEAIQPV